MNVILDLPYHVCIWISASVAILYTLLGGLYSVAYTDIIQLSLIFISLVSSALFTRNMLDLVLELIEVFKKTSLEAQQHLICPHITEMLRRFAKVSLKSTRICSSIIQLLC